LTQNGVRGVVFDMDGVIVDSHPAHRCAWRQFLQGVGREATEEELDFILDGRKREDILRHFLGELSAEQVREYGNRKDEMLRRLGNGIQPVEGITDFLAALKRAGLKTAVATSAGRTRTHGTLSDLGLTHHFDAIITGDEVSASKPDPLIYRLAAERIHEHPEHLVAIEDAAAGVKSATCAGLRCIGIASSLRADRLREAGAHPVVPHFRSLSIASLHALVP
jgi:beta-phosphoglucomutase